MLENQMVFANVYSVTRHWGGSEEGGWYWNKFECIDSVQIKPEDEFEWKDKLEQKYKGLEHGDIYSVNGGRMIAVFVEDEIAESETKEVPHYE